MVWRLYKFQLINNWWQNIDLRKQKIVLLDNNFIATPIEHIREVVGILKTYRKEVDFNQGLDCRIWNEEIAKIFEGLRIHPLRFAYDNKTEDDFIVPAIELAFKHNLKDISMMMLYNFTDTPKEIYLRIQKIARIKKCSRIMIFLMKYQPLNTEDKGVFISKNWSIDYIKNFKHRLNQFFINGIIRFNNYEQFEKVLGKTYEDFLKILNTEIKYDKFEVKYQNGNNGVIKKQSILNFD